MDIGRIRPTLAMKEQSINTLPPTEFFIRSGRIEQGTGRLRDVTIYDLSLPTARRVVYADSGRMMMESGGTTLRLLLYQGEVHEYRPEEQGTVRVTRFAVNTIRARDVANALERSTEIAERGDRELSVCQMMDRRSVARDESVQARRQRELYTRKDLRSVLRLMPEEPVMVAKPDSVVHCGVWRKFERAVGKVIFPRMWPPSKSIRRVEAGRSGSEARARLPSTPPKSVDAGRRNGLAPAMAPVVLSGLSEVSESRPRKAEAPPGQQLWRRDPQEVHHQRVLLQFRHHRHRPRAPVPRGGWAWCWAGVSSSSPSSTSR
jgi:hypothetical protein